MNYAQKIYNISMNKNTPQQQQTEKQYYLALTCIDSIQSASRHLKNGLCVHQIGLVIEEAADEQTGFVLLHKGVNTLACFRTTGHLLNGEEGEQIHQRIIIQ